MKRSYMFLLLLLVLGATCASAQVSTVYAAVVSTKLFVVGAANPQTGIFYKGTDGDTAWLHTGPDNIRAFDVAVPASAKGSVRYIAAGNGLHMSTDAGQHWKVTTGWEITEVLWVAPDSKDYNTVYIATAYGIYKTMDGCRTWKQMNHGLTSTFTPCVIVDHANSSMVYCATEDGVFVSHDGAASWSRLGLSVGNARVIAQHPRDPKILVVGTENNGIYISRNGGSWWEKCEAGVDHSTFYTIAFDPGNPDCLYAGGYVTGVYKSIDGGKSWIRLNEGIATMSIHGIAVDPLDGRRVFAATFWHGVYRSEDGGATWRPDGLGGSEVWNIHIESH